MEQLKNELKEQLKTELTGQEQLDLSNAVDVSSYIGENNKYTFPSNGFLIVEYCELTSSPPTRTCSVTLSSFPFTPRLNDNEWGILNHFSTIINAGQTLYFTFSDSNMANNFLEAYFIPFK